MKMQACAAWVVMGLFAGLSVAAEVNLQNAKCLVSGKACNAEAAADYKGGSVYFCCKNCLAEFNKNSAKYSTPANHQLAVTGQARQIGCPFSGKATDAAATVEVNGAKVGLCCKNCLAKVEKAANANEKVEMLFSDAAFKKGFQVGK